MKQQHLILVLAVLSLIMFGWFFVLGENNSGRSLVDPITPNETLDIQEEIVSGSTNLRELLYSANVVVPEVQPETTVKLTGEVTEYGDFGSGGASPSGTIALGPVAVGSTDLIFTTITVNTGGSGDFTYLAAFRPGSDYRMIAYYGLGDRIRVDKFVLEDGSNIVVEYRTHGEEQAMAEEPSQKETAEFIFENESFSKK